MKLVIGLGNPGKEYEHTRHNVGWEAVTMAAKTSRPFMPGHLFIKQAKFYSEVLDDTVDGQKVLFIHPLTFMNESGRAVVALKNFYKCDNADILIVHDEMDFAVGEMAFTKEAGPAGHNGVESVQTALGTKTISRLRIGIGRPDDPARKHDHVLSTFDKDESRVVDKQLNDASGAIKAWITDGIDKTMNKWNGV